ncbi:ABC transporter permease [Muricoccus vinaceus]|uniref:ABC transporter permease n=1 Tax=Muricoccus vinaceus TaxID=424704 RepID=A0ABV6IQM3_9PROT
MNREALVEGWQEYRRSPVAVAALALVVAIALLALLAPWIAPQDPYDQSALDLMDARLEPGSIGSGEYVHWLGTDNAGRDLLSAILYGLRLSLAIAVTAGIVALTVGTAIGLSAAYYGGWFGAVAMRVVDLQLSLPAILLALVLVAVLGQGVPQLMAALVAAQYAYFARTAFGAASAERRKDYVEAALSTPLSGARVLWRHLLPNTLPPLIVVVTVQIATAISLEATLSFLGLGLPVTRPSLGLLIANGFQFMLSGRYWISVYPGIALMVTVLAINLVGDQLRQVINPRRRR